MASCKLIIEDEVNIKLEGLEVDVRRKLASALKFEVALIKAYHFLHLLVLWHHLLDFLELFGGS